MATLNLQFYQTFARAFCGSRQNLQPGVQRVLERLGGGEDLLDLGCGNGAVARALAERGHGGFYLGVDFSLPLLRAAAWRTSLPSHFAFLIADIARPTTLRALRRDFDGVLAFAVLHHIPGAARRLQVVRAVGALLPSGGFFIHSHWQFLRAARWRRRVQPWSVLGISPAEVEAGDYLLDWRRQGYGLRYVHHFSPEELENLAAQSGFALQEQFYADGKEGDLGLYQVWRKV